MQELIKAFKKQRYFIRIYETSKDFIFWNDINIFKKIPKTEINKILKTVSIEKFVNDLILFIENKIKSKYSESAPKREF